MIWRTSTVALQGAIHRQRCQWVALQLGTPKNIKAVIVGNVLNWDTPPR